MKERQKKMLRFMLLNEGVLHIEDLAETFSIGKRTVSRDLDILDRWLSIRGASLARKPNQGIKILTFGKSPEELLDIINTPDTYLQSLEPAERQQLILLYLLFNNREIKISTIANAFFISDTSVWSDLNLIGEEIKQSDLGIERLKGVGIRIVGEESKIRLKFLHIMTEVFSSFTIIPYLYAIKEDRGSFLEINQLKFLIKRLNFPGNNNTILNIISRTSNELGYQFTMSGEALLYFYLQLSLHRIKSGALITSGHYDCVDYYHELGKTVIGDLVKNVLNGSLPASESEFLGLILQVLEVGDVAGLNQETFIGIISPQIKKFTNDIISEFGKLDKRQYYLNEQMEGVLSFTAASLITRLKYGVPFWHGEWGDPSAENWNREKKAEILSELLDSQFNLKADRKDLDYILIYFHSMIFSSKDLPDKKIRALVCCFEGIGLASYLQSILRREIDTINVVEATAVFKIRQEYLDANGIELIISTFPVNDLEIPVINISLPLNRERLIHDIASVVFDLKGKTNHIENRSYDGENITNSRVSFGEILSFINDFSILTLAKTDDINEIIAELSKKLTNSNSDFNELSSSFRRREDSGPLFFEDWGLRVLHCKSGVVSRPRAGILEFEGHRDSRILFMVAPDPCPDAVRKLLSTITVSVLENSTFRNSVLSGGIDEIKKELLEIYQNF